MQQFFSILGYNERSVVILTPCSIPIQPTIQKDRKNTFPNQKTKNWCQHVKLGAPWHPRAYKSTYQQGLAIFYCIIIYCPTKFTVLQATKDGFFSTWQFLT